MLNIFASHIDWAITGGLPTRLFLCGPYKWLLLIFSLAIWLLDQFLNCAAFLRSTKDRQEVKRGPKRQLPLPPGSLGLPFLGEMFQFIIQSPTAEFFTRRISSYGPIFKTHILFNPTVFVSGPDAVRQVLLGEHSLVENRWPLPMRILLGPGALATAVGRAHRERRKVILRCLRGERLDAYLPRMRAAIEEEMGGWGEVIEVYGCAKRMAIRVAAEVLLGVEAREVEEVGRWIMEYGGGFFAVPLALPGSAYYKALRAKGKLHKLLRSSLQTKVSEISPCHHDVISEILANSSIGTTSRDASVDHVIDQALELLFGGQETLSAFVTCLVLLLAKNPHVIGKMSRELAENDSLLDDAEHISVTSLANLTYFDYVIREVLRLYPPIGGGYRRVIKSFELQGFRIPLNWSVTYSIKATHDCSSYFSRDKDAFRPERWASLPGQGTLLEPGRPWRMRCDYLPFGAGTRACVGQRYATQFMRLFSVLLVRRMAGWKLVTHDPVMLTVPVIRPEHGLYVSFRRRSDYGDVER